MAVAKLTIAVTSQYGCFLAGIFPHSARHIIIPLSTTPLGPFTQAIFFAATRCNFCRAQSCNFKIARVNQVRFLLRFVAAISQGSRTCLKLDAILARQKLHRVAATKIAFVNGPLTRAPKDREGLGTRSGQLQNLSCHRLTVHLVIREFWPMTIVASGSSNAFDVVVRDIVLQCISYLILSKSFSVIGYLGVQDIYWFPVTRQLLQLHRLRVSMF